MDGQGEEVSGGERSPQELHSTLGTNRVCILVYRYGARMAILTGLGVVQPPRYPHSSLPPSDNNNNTPHKGGGRREEGGGRREEGGGKGEGVKLQRQRQSALLQRQYPGKGKGGAAVWMDCWLQRLVVSQLQLLSLDGATHCTMLVAVLSLL